MNTRGIQSLAKVLARNHIAHSQLIVLGTGLAGDSFVADERPVRRERVIVVVGAGASHSACNLPLGRDAARMLRERLSHVHHDLVERELDRLTLEHRLDRRDLETQLLALSRFDRPKLLEELEKLFSRRYYPSLSYEILAHLLKHRFVDAIFNFNFDEILDQPIEDETGNGGCYKVVWDGDCREPLADLARPSGTLRLPLYVKPHGTVSSKSSMRFTRGDYFLLPRELNELTAALICELPLRLVVIGHAMNSFEFNALIARHRPKDFHSFVLCPELAESHETLGVSERFPESRVRLTHIPITSKAGLDERLSALWAMTDRQIVRFPRPRGIIRHRLITTLFGAQVDSDDPAPMSDVTQEHYLHDRMVVETCLAIAKAKGFIHLRQLMQSRAGRYFTLFKHRSNSSHESLLGFCLRLGMTVISGDTLRLGNSNRSGNRAKGVRGRQSLIRGRNAFLKADIAQLTARARERLTPERARLLESNRLLFRRTLQEMYDGDEVEVLARRDDYESEYFTDAVPLPTLGAMRLATRTLLKTDWDLILCVAETGEWLVSREMLRSFRHNVRGRVKVVVVDTTRASDVRIKLRSTQHVEIRWLPWWLHNQHMTLFLRRSKPLGGILFERRPRSSTIAPVYLQPADADRAIDKFIGYWLRGEGFASHDNDFFVDQPMVEQARQEVLGAPNRGKGAVR